MSPRADQRRRRAGTGRGMRHRAAPLLILMAGSGMATDSVELTPLPLDGWRLVSDGVMGGVSRGELVREERLGEPCLGLRGQVSTDNNGGFIQIVLDVDADALAARDQEGIRLEVSGNGEPYNLHLRTANLWLPWQSYRATFETASEWREVRLPFGDFTPYRTGAKLDLGRLRRIGIVAIGRDFSADICVKDVALYRTTPPR